MLRKQVTIASPEGLHARPANDFARLAMVLPGKVMVSRPGGNKVRGDSMLSLIDDDSQETLLETLISLLSSH
jgi:phosphocarrier protein HPr